MKHPRLSYCIKRERVKPKPTPEHDYSKDYFTIVSLEDNNDIKWYRDTISGEPIPIEYSIDDGNTWITYTPITINQSVKLTTLNTGQKMLIRAVTEKWVIDSEGGFYGKPVSTKNVDIEGNIMSLLYGEDFVDKNALPDNEGTFRYFFAFQGYLQDLEGLYIVSAKNLIMPATTLTRDCYNRMFQNCTTIVEAPSILPATTLVQSCYYGMFKDCSNLTTTPELPATTLVNYCYGSMFNGCKKVNYIKAMFITTPNSAYTGTWVSGVAASGTFVKNSAAQWDVTSVHGVPTGWTIENAN